MRFARAARNKLYRRGRDRYAEDAKASERLIRDRVLCASSAPFALNGFVFWPLNAAGNPHCLTVSLVNYPLNIFSKPAQHAS